MNIITYISNSTEYENILEARQTSEGNKKGKKTQNLKTKNTSSKKK